MRREEHRLWVHVVGTECDLIEWDEPDPEKQGVGMPQVVEKEVAAAPAQALFWVCGACSSWNEGGESCSVCQTPRPGLEPARQAANRGRGGRGRGGMRTRSQNMMGGAMFGRFAMGFEEEEDDEEVCNISRVPQLFVAAPALTVCFMYIFT